MKYQADNTILNVFFELLKRAPNRTVALSSDCLHPFQETSSESYTSTLLSRTLHRKCPHIPSPGCGSPLPPWTQVTFVLYVSLRVSYCRPRASSSQPTTHHACANTPMFSRSPMCDLQTDFEGPSDFITCVVPPSKVAMSTHTLTHTFLCSNPQLLQANLHLLSGKQVHVAGFVLQSKKRGCVLSIQHGVTCANSAYSLRVLSPCV